MPLSRLLRIHRLLESLENYGNPFEILLRRRSCRDDELIRVVDRRTGVAVRCKKAAHRMFGEVWFDHDYDVPAVPLRRGDAVIDIGANQGFFTCYAASKGCTVYAFEPDPENLRLLECNVESNGFTGLVRILPKAVKGSAGATRLFRSSQLGGGMHTTSAKFAEQQGIGLGDSVDVAAVNLHQFLQEETIPQVRLCKMDCEGAELEIIESLDPADAARIDSFAIEYHREVYAPVQMIEALERLGTHHISAAAPKYCERAMLYAVSKAVFKAAPEFQS